LTDYLIFVVKYKHNLKTAIMKKALLTLGIAISTLSIQAQDIRVGLTGGLNSTWLLNKNVFDQGDNLDVASTFGGRIGIEGIYSFSEKAGVSLGINFLSNNSQKYTGDVLNFNYDVKTKLSYIDIPVLFRLTSSGGTYFEIGPQIGLLTSATQDSSSSAPGAISYSGKDVKYGYNSTNFALVFGFGADIDVSENIYITTGLRLGYGFSDVTKEFSTDAEFDNALPVGGVQSFSTNAANTDDKGNFNYEATNRAFGGLHLGVSYKFAK
jgi:hypothetical protein